MNWPLWGIVLLLQNFSFTLVSRSRNSASIRLHALMSIFSNGTWILSQMIVIHGVVEAFHGSDWHQMARIGLFYMTLTTASSIFAHWFAMRYVERWFKISR